MPGSFGDEGQILGAEGGVGSGMPAAQTAQQDIAAGNNLSFPVGDGGWKVVRGYLFHPSGHMVRRLSDESMKELQSMTPEERATSSVDVKSGSVKRGSPRSPNSGTQTPSSSPRNSGGLRPNTAGGNTGVKGPSGNTTTTTQQQPEDSTNPFTPPSGGSGFTPTGSTPPPGTIDPTAPMGIPAINPPAPGGSSYFGGGQTPFSGAFNPFEGLGPNSSMNDVISRIAGSQVANRNAALANLGGVFNESQGGVSAQLRGQTGNLLANPFSLDEGTVNKIMGRSTDAINQRTNMLSQQAAQRGASAGLRGDSGTLLAQQGNIAQEGARQVGEGERNIQIQAAMQNKEDLRNALGAAGGAINEDLGRRERLAGQAALGVLGESAITGDAFLTNAMLSAQGKQPFGMPNMGSGPTGRSGPGMFGG